MSVSSALKRITQLKTDFQQFVEMFEKVSKFIFYLKNLYYIQYSVLNFVLIMKCIEQLQHHCKKFCP